MVKLSGLSGTRQTAESFPAQTAAIMIQERLDND